MSRKTLVLFNPYSGKKKARSKLTALQDKLQGNKIPFDILETKEHDNVNHIREYLNSSFTDLVVLGGDGTLNHAINAIINKDIIISIIPSGTGNDFIKNIQVGKSLGEQMDTAIHGAPTAIDVGQCDDRLFINGVGIGFDGQIVYDMLNKHSILKGHAEYYAQVLRILATYSPQPLGFEIDEDQQRLDTFLLVIGNGSTFGGGFVLTPGASINDGLLDICHIGQLSPLKRFMNIHRLSSGTHAVLSEVKLSQTTHIKIDAAPGIQAHIDGEYLGTPPFNIKILPEYIKVRVLS